MQQMQLGSGSAEKSSGQIEADHELDAAMIKWIQAYGLVPARNASVIEYMRAYQHLCYAVMSGVMDTLSDG